MGLKRDNPVLRGGLCNAGWDDLVTCGDPPLNRPGRPNVALLNASPFCEGVANLGFQAVADYLNSHDINVYIGFLDTISGGPFLNDREAKLEDCEVVGFSIPFETTYLNVLKMLDHCGLPLLSSERDRCYPLVVGGGMAMINPLPLSPFLDVVVLGEGLQTFLAVVRTYMRCRSAGTSMRETLLLLAQLEGVYVPSHYELSLNPSGTVESFRSLNGRERIVANRPFELGATPIFSRWTSRYSCYDLDDYFSVMVAMGCHNKCSFCVVGHTQGAASGKALSMGLDQLVAVATARRERYGTHLVKIFFSSAFSSNESHRYEDGIKILLDLMLRHGFKCRVGSLNIQQADEELFRLLSRHGQTEVTFAPETVPRLRRVLGKGYFSNERLLTVAGYAKKCNFNMNVYSLCGVPGETIADVVEYAEFLKAIRKELGASNQLTLHYNPVFVKAQTPLEFFGNCKPDDARDRYRLVRAVLADLEITYVSVIDDPLLYYQPILSIGDLDSAKVLRHLYKVDNPGEREWHSAFRQLGLSDAKYFTDKPVSEVLPWEHLVFVDHDKMRKRAKDILRGSEDETAIIY